jgi:O-antigen/teichoic acid export membrane protein
MSVFLKEFEQYQVILVGLAAPFYALHLHIVHFLRSVKKVGLANLAFVSTELALFVLTAVFAAKTSLTNETVVIAVVIAWISVSAAYLLVLSQSGYSIRPKVNRQLIVRNLRYGIKTQASGVFQFLNYRIDQLIIGAFLGATDLGLYSVASKSAELFRFFSRSVSFTVEPILAGHQYENAHIFVRKNRWKIFSANLMFMTFGLLLVPAVLPLVFGDWAVAATPYFYILSIGLIVGGSNGLMGAYNKAIGEPERNTRVMLAGLLAASALNLVLVPAIGISGAAWASVFAQVSVTAYFWAQFRWAGVKVSEIAGRSS